MTQPRDTLNELRWEDVPQLMDELQEMARRLLTRWPGMGSLQPTLLVSTALRRQRRVDQPWEDVTWDNRGHFFSQMFQAMHHKLVEYRRHQQTRGYRAQRQISVADLESFERWRSWTTDPDLALALQAALAELEERSPELARIVEYRFFAGLTWDETAKILECSLATVKRRWKQARLAIEETIRKRGTPPNDS